MPKKKMKAKSIKGRSPEKIQSALQQSMADGFKPTLAIVFLSVKQDREAICSLLNNEGIRIFGSTTSGEFISSEISEGGIAIMLLDINPSCFKIMFRETSNSSTYEVSRQLGAEGKKLFAHPAFIIASGWLHTDGEQIINGIEEGVEGEPTIFGGMAGDDLALSGPIVFSYEKSSITRLVAIIIDEDKINVRGIATCVTSEEPERVMNVWNAPFIGFFSYGEFGKSKRGKHEFHSNTCCVVALKEK